MLAFKQIIKQGKNQLRNTNLLSNQQQQITQLQNQIPKYSFAKKSKHPFKVAINEDVINVKDVKYPFDKYEDGVYSPEKPKLFTQTFKKRQLEAKQKKEFILYQQSLKNVQAVQEKMQEKQQVEKEFLWDQGVPELRPYDNVQNKELTYIYRDSRYFERSNLMISHLKDFQVPQQIHDQEIRNIIDFIKKEATEQNINNPDVDFIIEEFYQQNEQIVNKFNELKNLLFKINYKLLPQIGLALSYELRYKIDFAGVWNQYLQVLEQNLHHYTTIELAQIKHALGGNYPKQGSPTLHKAILDIATSELHLCNTSELLHVMHAFRNLKNNKIYKRIVNEIVSRQAQIQEADELAAIIYTYASSRIRTSNRPKYREDREEIIEAEKLIDIYINDLLRFTPEMSPVGLVQLVTAMNILRLPGNYKDILRRIEAASLAQKDKFSPALLGQLFYSFSKVQNGQGFGSAKFYSEFQPIVQKNFNNLNNSEKSKILYAYQVRKQIDQKTFNTAYLPWIKQEMANFTYSDLHYISQVLIVQDVTDKNIWKAYIHNVVNQPYVIPSSNYLPIKQARYYMDALFPEWNFEPFDEMGKNAEFSFSIERIKNKALSQEIIDFGRILKTKLELDIKLFVEFDNLLLVDYAVLPERVAILYQDSQSSQYDDLSVSSIRYDIKAKILEANKWGVLQVKKKDLEDQELNRYTWLQEQFQAVYKKQQEVYKEEELERWGRTVQKMEYIGEKATLENEKHKASGITIEF